jgi:hypothetical protein
MCGKKAVGGRLILVVCNEEPFLHGLWGIPMVSDSKMQSQMRRIDELKICLHDAVFRWCGRRQFHCILVSLHISATRLLLTEKPRDGAVAPRERKASRTLGHLLINEAPGLF